MAQPKNPRHQAFAEEYMADGNATRATIAAGFSSNGARQTGARLLARPDIQAYLETLRAQRAERTEITADKVIEEIALVAFADHAELSQYRIGACRYCHGKNHKYQWRHPDEFTAAKKAWHDENTVMARKQKITPEEAQKIAPPPTDAGGYGYTKNLPPNPECKMCDGDGISYIVFADTTRLSPRARALFAGVKQTQHGIEFKAQDKMRALEMLGRHHNLFKGEDEPTATGIAAVLAEIAAAGSRAPMGATAEMPPEVERALAEDPTLGGRETAPVSPPAPKPKAKPEIADEIDPETGEVLP
jgi:phage terminase small subunit